MVIQLRTGALDGLVRKQMDVGSYSDPFATGSPMPDAAGSTTGDLIKQYLVELEAKGLRELRENTVWLSRAIEHLKHRVAWAEKRCVPKDASKEWSTAEQEAADQIMHLLDHPNPAMSNDSFGGLWGAAVEDVLTINQGAVQKLNYSDPPEMAGLPAQLKVLDGARVSQIKGWKPGGTGPRWEVAMGTGKLPVKLNDDELIVINGNPTSYNDGIAPAHTLRRFLLAELATFKRMHLIQVQSTPGGAFILPGANEGTPDAMAEEYEANIQGNAGVIFINVPAESRYVEIGSADLEKQGSFQFYEILVRGIATAFGIPPMVLGWYADVNKGYGEVAQDMSYEGVVNLLRLLAQYINNGIVAAWGEVAENIRFTFDQLEVEDEAEEATSLRTKAGSKDFALIKELRTAGGYEPINENEIPAGARPFLDELWVPTPVGNAVMQLPWTYFFKFTKIDPDTGELPEDSPLLPQPKQAPPALAGAGLHLLPPPGEEPPEAAGMSADQTAGVAERIGAARKALTTSGDPDTVADALDELDGINDLLQHHFDAYVPEEAEDDDAGRPGDA